MITYKSNSVSFWVWNYSRKHKIIFKSAISETPSTYPQKTYRLHLAKADLKSGTKCSNWCNLPAMGNAYLKELGLSELHWEYSRWPWKKARKSTHCFINKEISKKQNCIYESFPSIHTSQLSFPSDCLKILIENLLKHILLIQLAWKWHPMPLNKQSLFKSFIIKAVIIRALNLDFMSKNN